MQEIINAMLKVILDDGSQAKPIFNAIRRGNDMFVEFHSGYTFYFDGDYITIVNAEKGVKERARRSVNAKISVEFMNAIKDWLNLDFNSGIIIDDESSTVQEGNEPSVGEAGKENDGEETSEVTGDETGTETKTNEKADMTETKKPNRPTPSRATVKKK